MFTQQEHAFLNGITEEIAFDGGWKPEPYELLTVPLTEQVGGILQAAKNGVLGLAQVDAEHFGEENIRGLCVLVQRPGGDRLLLQNFDARQILNNKIAFWLSGDTFTQLTEPAFSIATNLAGIVTDDVVKFRSFSSIRRIFDLKHLYIEATDAQVDAFSGHAALKVADPSTFKTMADQSMRKLIHAIGHRGTLELYSTQQIAEAAVDDGLNVFLEEGRIVVPTEKQAAKTLLHFLDDAYYTARLTGLRYITNSKRAAVS